MSHALHLQKEDQNNHNNHNIDKDKQRMSANQNYEKLQLSKQDLRYLFSQLRNDITSKLDYHVPGSGPRDPLKMEVENQLNQFLLETFEMAKNAMVIDGHDLQDQEIPVKELLSLENMEEVAPFDTELNNSLREIIGEVERETTEMTRLRRELPKKSRNAYSKLISDTDMNVTMALTNLETESEEQEEKAEFTNESKLKEIIPRIDHIIEDYQQSLLLLNESKKTIPERRAELESLDESIQFLEASYLAQKHQPLVPQNSSSI